MKNAAVFLAVTAGALLTGCSASRTPAPDGGGSGGQGPALFGHVTVQLVDDPDPAAAHATVQAAFFDGPPAVPNPGLGPLAVSQTDGDCQLLVPKVVACTPACSGGLCTDDNHCTPIPAHQTAGPVQIQGLAGMDLMLQPMGPAFAYSGAPTLPFPPCAEGDAVTAQAGAFTLAGTCIAPLRLSGTAPLPVTSGQAVAVAWTPPGRPGRSRVQLALEISHHGGYKGEIDCDVADTGMFSIPAPLVTALISLGRGGYPTIQITRVGTAASTEQPGVKLILQSLVERDVDTGVTSCMTSDTCPTGTTCQVDFTCR